MQITITPGEAQALFNLIDREVRISGGQAAATFGNILRQMIEQAQVETASEQEQEANG
jgi:hypothetical protein